MNPPARLNAEPVAFTLRVKGKRITWPANITWTPKPPADAMEVDQPVLITTWPDNFAMRYKQDVYETDGEADAHFPLSGKTARFVNKGSFQPDQDLEKLVDYLEERYQAIGIKTVRQRFTWRGIPQSNLIAIINGTENVPPVILADHVDAACEEDTFTQSGKRVTTKGADDNATATAALLGAASALKDLKLKRDIWLLHLTGEEFPSDDLGARYFLSEMMKTKQDIYAVVITDFIGWHQTGQSAYQISPDAMPGSERMAALAIDAARKVSPNVTAIYQARNQERNSVFQTDRRAGVRVLRNPRNRVHQGCASLGITCAISRQSSS